MKILLFGKRGQVGSRLQDSLLPLGEIIALGTQDVNFCDESAVRAVIRKYQPTCIVNAAAFTAVDKAEEEEDQAFTINAEAVRVIAEEAAKLDAWVVHYSTDYVFDGSKEGAYTEEDTVNPLSIYGRSKAQGDAHVVNLLNKYLILRASWIFDAFGKNFPKTILRLAKERDQLRVVNDQVGGPTSASLVAQVTALLLYRIKLYEGEADKLSGIYNISAQGQVSWYEFACKVIQLGHLYGVNLRCASTNVVAVDSAQYPVAARRPLNSKLDSSKICRNFGISLPEWEAYLPIFFEELRTIGWI